MNINFHYFVVKTLASEAGFGTGDAQFLAGVSQYVDDYNLKDPIYLKNVPEYARHLTDGKDEKGWKFIPITTGFYTLLDNIELVINTNEPEMIVMPFHFIPEKPYNTYAIDPDKPADPSRGKLRTSPVTLGQDSLLQGLLLQARDSYRDEASRENLMRVGMLVHTFADTYAHQGFSGLWGWENQSRLKTVTDDKDGKDITASYKISFYAGLPALAHANVSTAPDDSFVTFEREYKGGLYSDYNLSCKRDNVEEFKKAAKEIYNYLLGCLGKESAMAEEWETLEPKLVEGFYGQTLPDVEKCLDNLYSCWQGLFPNIGYSYDKDKMFLDESGNRDDDFFRYNVLAKEMRDTVNGYETPLV